jgi:RNA polymerase sigma factor (TIGR02999 family)
MTEVTQILCAVEQGDDAAADRLFPLVYDELRRMAARQIAQEKPGQTLQATALVHEAYLRLVDVEQAQRWNSRGHFFTACAEAMRRILVDRARSRGAEKRGGDRRRVDLAKVEAVAEAEPEELLALDEAIEQLSRHDPAAGRLVQLLYFAGLSVEQAGEAMGISRASAYRTWTFARAWLRCRLGEGEAAGGG